jgi:hypothetical protein
MQKLRLYVCAIPVFGLIPSAIALVGNTQNQRLKDTAKVSLGLLLVWLLSYASLGTGGEISQELYRGTAASMYFLACFGIMLRIYQGKSLALSAKKSKRKSD